MKISVIIPVYGLQHLTDAVVEDLRKEMPAGDICIIDNKGDYAPRAGETVLIPGENLRWARGSNFGLHAARTRGYDAYILLNNDTRLSPGFLDGLVQAWQVSGAALLGPLYDDVHDHQKGAYRGPAAQFPGSRELRWVPFIDGTCMFIPAATLERIGLLDEERFGQYGWGADFDYAIRIKNAGQRIAVSCMSYLNHFHQQTSKTIMPNWNEHANAEMQRGMRDKWGDKWNELVLRM